MKKIFTCCTILIFNCTSSAQTLSLNFDNSENKIKSDDTLYNKSELVKNDFHIGLQAGLHSGSLDNNALDFDQDIYLELYTKINLSHEVFLLVSLNYWKAQIEKKNLTSTDLIESNALRVGVDFSLFKIYKASFLLGPSISIGDNTEATNAGCSFGTSLKLNFPLSDDEFNLLTSVNYQNAFEILNFGGGIKYSFFYYLVGIEVKL